MSEASAIDAAARRLSLALDNLQAAVERKRESERGGGASEQLHALGMDRARLAAELDGAVAQARALESTNREVARRIEQAMATIRDVLDEHER